IGASLWGLKALQQPFQALSQFEALLLAFQDQLRKPIATYLSNGDPSHLLAAEQGIDRLQAEQMPHLPDSVRAAMTPTLDSLKTHLQTDVLAAGKLAGDPQGLLLQNERESRQTLSSLLDYVQEGAALQPEAAFILAQDSARLLEVLHLRATLRQKYFDQRQPALHEELVRVQQDYHARLQALQSRPLPGLMSGNTPSADDLFFGRATPQEDRAIELRETLLSLSGR